jgi:single-strand DNA-binding protein
VKFELEGTVKHVFDLKQVSERFSKREFVIEVEDGKYSQTIMFECTGKALDYIGDFKPGNTIRVHFNVRGREWQSKTGETKYFNTLAAWRVEKPEGQKSTSSQGAPPAEPPMDNDDIPF